MSFKIQLKIISSLEKVFWDEELNATEYNEFSALRGERFSFQAAVKFTGRDDEKVLLPLNETLKIKAELETDMECRIDIREVAAVQVNHPTMIQRDDDFLRVSPGIYPDILNAHCGKWNIATDQWRCLWFAVNIPENAKSGRHNMNVRLYNADNGKLVSEKSFTLKVIPATMPKQKTFYTQWFHLDCLASYYKTPVFSEKHWSLIENYMRHAAENGVNLILTPVFTPPLDTEVGCERLTVQLVDVYCNAGEYTFDFSKLDRYMSIAEKSGIENFEISHLFTQWGAKYAPKIMAYEHDRQIKIFGWETKGSSDEYKTFLKVFLNALRGHLSELGKLKNCYFHISDEPGIDACEKYSAAYEIVSRELFDCNIIDALSDYEFYKRGYKGCPVSSLDHIDKFIENGVEKLWAYYCNGQSCYVSNRLIAMPSYRNRILGMQLYKYGIGGFLQWGYNYWYSFLSKELINPFIETGALNALPAGDAFSVYPGEDGNPIPSLREAVFFENLQDIRALQLLESLIGRIKTLEILDPESQLTITEYPRSAEWLIEKREKINEEILRAIVN